MRLLLLPLLVLLSYYSIGQSQSPKVTFNWDSLMTSKEKEIVGKPFPSFVAANEEGQISNEALKGKVVLVNFWFEGCHPCIAEMGALNELAEQLKDNKQFRFISFSKDNAEAIQRVKEKYKLRFSVYQASAKECIRLNHFSGFPTTFILDRNGIIKYWMSGGSIDPEKAREEVMNILLPKIRKEL